MVEGNQREWDQGQWVEYVFFSLGWPRLTNCSLTSILQTWLLILPSGYPTIKDKVKSNQSNTVKSPPSFQAEPSKTAAIYPCSNHVPIHFSCTNSQYLNSPQSWMVPEPSGHRCSIFFNFGNSNELLINMYARRSINMFAMDMNGISCSQICSCMHFEPSSCCSLYGKHPPKLWLWSCRHVYAVLGFSFSGRVALLAICGLMLLLPLFHPVWHVMMW